MSLLISRTFPKPISNMKGATALNDGVAGLVPAPVAGDQGKMLNGGGQWALPGVVTINGRSPNPVTGDIVVIEGGGSSSYGSYRLDALIATTDWVEDNGAYVAQVTNSLITANMDGVETWLDDESAMLGDTSFATSEGMLTVTTAVMPVASWSLHVSLAVNGADVLADVSALQTTVTNLQASDAAQTANMSKIIPILSGTTNNSGYTINSGEYFEVEGTLYKATAAIPNGSAWAGSSTAMGAGETAINSLNSNVALMDMIAVCSSGSSFASVSLLNFNGSLRNNSIFVKYNDKYVSIVGVARYNDVTRTGANPGIIITLPVPVKSTDFGGIARIPTASENEYASMATSNQKVTISITESTTNYTATMLTVEIPYVVFERA